VTVSNARSWPGLVVAGEPVVIPRRIYNPEPSPGFARGLGGVEAVVAAAIYSRNHDGYVRQRQLAALLGSDEPWAAPFIVALLGEYVIEICLEIERFARTEFPARPAMRQSMSAFFAANRPFIELTRQRAISYWLCDFRSVHARLDAAPALAALAIFGG
jgi:hypothetical protein